MHRLYTKIYLMVQMNVLMGLCSQDINQTGSQNENQIIRKRVSDTGCVTQMNARTNVCLAVQIEVFVVQYKVVCSIYSVCFEWYFLVGKIKIGDLHLS